MKKTFYTLLILASALSGCVSTLPETPYPLSATYQVTTDIRFNMSHRKFLLHVPPGTAPDEPLPLVVVIHGAFSTARQTEQETGFSDLADQENFLVAYPEGIGIFGLLQHWNAGHCCGKAAKDDIDDVAFIANVISMISQRMAVDSQRIYMAGMSNGGMLTYRYAAERGHDLAAIAIVSGVIGSRNGEDLPEWVIPEPKYPLPVIVFHGTDDEHIPVNGGLSPLKGGKRSYLSVMTAMSFWGEANGCSSAPLIHEQRQGAVTSFRWPGCADNQNVEYLQLDSWGHRWPALHYTSQLPESDKLHNYNATQEIWNFMKRFRRQPTKAVNK